MQLKSALALTLLLATGGAVRAADDHSHHAAAAPSACADVSLACADKATPFFTGDGVLWLAWTANGRVAVQKSRDLGRSFDAPMFVNRTVEKLDAGADSRPQIVVDGAGRAVAAYTISQGADFAGRVLVASAQGSAFTQPTPLTQDDASQRFVSFTLDPGGKVFAAWIDKRNLSAARKAGKPYDGAALTFAWARPGESFAITRIAQDNSCECCRIGVAFAGPDTPVVMWRHMFAGGVRDHAVTTFVGEQPGPVHRVAVDDWKIDACPHQGPSLAVAADGSYHATWFTEGRARQGVFYAHSEDGGRSFSAPMAVGDSGLQPSRPFVLTQAGTIWLVWKEFDGETSHVKVMQSRDGGKSWSSAKAIAATDDASDHPLLIAKGQQAFLSWLTRKEGYRLIPLENTP